jgi:hypothetical protein
MRKGRLTEEQMVAIIRDADRDQVTAVDNGDRHIYEMLSACHLTSEGAR